jgi:hypothetical protein
MSFQPKNYGSEKEPVRGGDLGALTGCSLAWRYDREGQDDPKETLRASEILEAAGREAILRALREGIWEADQVEKIFRDSYRRIAQKKPVDWEGRDPKQEGRSFLQMLKNFLPEARRRVASTVAIDAPFKLMLGGVACAGTIDLLYKNPEDKLCLAKITFERRRRSQWLLDHDPELALAAAAVLMGEIEGLGTLNAWPDRVESLVLRDLLPLKTGMRLRIEHPDQAAHFGVALWSSVVVQGNELRGPAFYQSRQGPGVLSRLEFSLKQFVAAVRGNRIVETFGEHCRFCPWQERCLGEGAGLLSRKELEVLDRALAQIPSP